MPVQPRIWSSLVAAAMLAAPPLWAQQPIKLVTVVTTFLADSGVRSKVLPWTTGGTLPVTWQSARPVSSDAEGYTLGLSGNTRVELEGHGAVPATIQLLGNNDGIQRATIAFDWKNPDPEVVERSLNLGLRLVLLRCSRTTEPPKAGNVLWEARATGKTPAGLAEAWSCGAGGCSLGLSLLYRRADVNSIRCLAPA